jgi:hypothetical protein
MRNLDRMKEELDSLKGFVAQSPYKEGDIRREYFAYIYDVLLNYYKGCSFVVLTKSMSDGRVTFKDGQDDIFPHIDGLVEILRAPELFDSYRNNLHRSITIDSWSIFEFSISILAEHFLSTDERETLFNAQYLEIKDILKNSIDQSKEEKLKKCLAHKFMAHVPVKRKTDKLYKKIGDKYVGSKDLDKNFLEFMGKYRNCTHSNYIYYGNKDYKYTFRQVEIDFRSGFQISHNKQIDGLFHFDMTVHLNKIFERIIKSIDHPQTILCPI